jgi:formylglycine-generating enzyme required for sulfatase activity
MNGLFNTVCLISFCLPVIIVSCTGDTSGTPDSSTGSDTDTGTDIDTDTDTDSDTDSDTDTDDDCTQPPAVADCTDGWCRIEPGCYILGSPVTEPCRGAYTENQVQVTLTRSFVMSKHEVTQAEWEAVGFVNPSKDIGPQKPVAFVNWLEAAAYANALSTAEGLDPCYDLLDCQGTIGSGCPGDWEFCNAALFADTYTCEGDPHRYTNWYECPGYRLPTSAEWEYAARAGATTATYNGNVTTDSNSCQEDTVVEPIAWYCNNSGDALHPVCGKQANGWGLFDMLGNVREWIDYVVTGFSMSVNAGSEGPLIDPIGATPEQDDRRSVKGGSLRVEACYCRAADHSGNDFDTRLLDTGFRLVRTLNPPPQPDAGVDAGK